MRFSVGIQTCLMVSLAVLIALTDAASRVRVRVSSTRISTYRSYRSYRYTYTPSAPYYTRRLSVSVMGPVYFGYASRYPASFSYRRTPVSSTGETCKNYLALSNGSFIGSFNCPFLPDEPGNWTRCCGYENEEFCCDPNYDDSWSNVTLGVGAIVGIVVGCLFALAVIIGLIAFCCVARSAVKASKASDQNKPFVDTQSSGQATGMGPVPPPYPTMEYGTIPVQPQGVAATAPYPPPPPYGNSH